METFLSYHVPAFSESDKPFLKSTYCHINVKNSHPFLYFPIKRISFHFLGYAIPDIKDIISSCLSDHCRSPPDSSSIHPGSRGTLFEGHVSTRA